MDTEDGSSGFWTMSGGGFGVWRPVQKYRCLLQAAAVETDAI